MTTAILSFATPGQVRLQCARPAIDETRLFGAAPFAAWASEYAAAQHHPAEELRLLELGRTIGAWLDGDQAWLRRLLDAAPAPLILEIETSARPGEIEQAALDAPWELIAGAGTGHLALDDRIRLSPVRRLDVPGDARPPSHCRLSVLFMAAQPRDVTALDFECEEAAIAAEVGKLGTDPFDLFVEESGTLDGLVAAAQQAAEHVLGDSGGPAGPVDVIHVSCHGRGGDAPALLLEDDVGDHAPATAGALAGALSAHVPGLAFVSACSTAEASAAGRSLAAELCTRGWPAIVGWSAPVGDGSATWFAARLYHRLAQRMPVAEALAWCRCEAVAPDRPARRVWHQARLFLGRAGGGPILGGTAARRPARAGQRQYLDRAERVPVARDDEFVGRRRALQRVLASLRDHQYVGAVVHGAGQLGKSSLAARVSHRRPELRTVVLYKDYDAGAILAAIATQVKTGTDEILARHRPPERWDAPAFGRALRELLEGPCGTAGAGAILLVVDDFEQVLVPPRAPETHAKVRTDVATTIGALIGAFSGARTASRLLFTSRHRFIAPDAQNLDLTRHLWHEPLGAMPVDDLAKRVRASATGGAALGRHMIVERATRYAEAIELCQGNPGLLQILLTIIGGAPASWPAVHAELRAYAEHGAPVTQADLAEFMARVALGRMIAELEPSGRELLRLLTVFETHVPAAVAAALGSLVGLADRVRGAEAIERMISLGLLDLTLPPSSRPGADASPRSEEREIAVNRLAASPAIAATRPMLDGEIAGVARTSLRPLRAAWNSAVRSRSLRECSELAALALLAGDTSMLAEVVGPVVSTIARTDARGASALVLAVEASTALWPDADELRRMAEACQTAGHPDVAGRLLQRGLALDDLTPGERARLQAALADWYRPRGDIDEALRLLREAGRSFERLGDVRSKAFTLGTIADILAARGELDEALRIHTEEKLPVHERLGDLPGRAATLGQIADILAARGELDEALRIRTEEQLPVYERLGNVRGKAITQGKIADILSGRGKLDEALWILKEVGDSFERLGDMRLKAVTQAKIADILTWRGELDEALRFLKEAGGSFERLGDVQATAVTQGQIADILFLRGELDEALQIRTKAELPVYERLGDVRAKAMTQGQIADILMARGELDGALRIRREEELPVYEQLGDVRAKAFTQGKIADILVARGELDEALRIRIEEQLPVYERLGDMREKAVTQGQIADILMARGELDEALRIQTEEELPVYERLGDARSKAVTQSKIAFILSARGELDEALRILKESCGFLEQLGDVQSLSLGLVGYAQMLLTKPTRDRIMEARGCLRRSAAIADRLGLQFPDELRDLLAQLEQLPVA